MLGPGPGRLEGRRGLEHGEIGEAAADDLQADGPLAGIRGLGRAHPRRAPSSQPRPRPHPRPSRGRHHLERGGRQAVGPALSGQRRQTTVSVSELHPMTDCLRVVFWGTRGSIAKPGPATVRYGGNTSCVEVRSPRGTLVILDCGTGAHGLGQALLASGERPLRGHILLSHTHWDHIQGIPFFAPLFVPGSEWDIYAPRGLGQHVKDTLAGQMQYTYFPVSLDRLPPPPPRPPPLS